MVGGADYLQPAAEFVWPNAPLNCGGTVNLQVYNDASSSSGFTTQLTTPEDGHAFFVAFSPQSKIAISYIWNSADFPWLGIWEENFSRPGAPWNSRTMTRGLEFGVSPFPEDRRRMIERGSLFGVPCYRWLAAKGSLNAEYWAEVRAFDSIPNSAFRPKV